MCSSWFQTGAHLQGHRGLFFFFYLCLSSFQCTTSLGMRALFELIAARPRPVAIFGGMCTEVNEPVAMALKYWQIVQLSYAETHAKFASADSQEVVEGMEERDSRRRLSWRALSLFDLDEWITADCTRVVALPKHFPLVFVSAAESFWPRATIGGNQRKASY